MPGNEIEKNLREELGLTVERGNELARITQSIMMEDMEGRPMYC